MTAFSEGAAHRPARPLLAIDWGTSSLRAVLFDPQGRAVDRLSAPRGILFTDGRSFPALFAELFGPWLARHPDAVALASGMIGSRQGWAEAPYCATPAGFADLAGAVRWVETGQGGRLGIVPGLSTLRDGVPDVMRGEEVQVFGALSEAGATDGLVVLPGTHSKWVEVEAGRIVTFRSFMTGEMFAVLRGHSILGRLMAAEDAARPLDTAAFAAGCAASRASDGGLLNRLFGVRTLGLFGRLTEDASPDYLSGLLIGEEVRAALSLMPAVPAEVRLACRGDLADRYRHALAAFGVGTATVDPDCAFTGLHALATRAGLLRPLA